MSLESCPFKMIALFLGLCFVCNLKGVGDDRQLLMCVGMCVGVCVFVHVSH